MASKKNKKMSKKAAPVKKASAKKAAAKTKVKKTALAKKSAPKKATPKKNLVQKQVTNKSESRVNFADAISPLDDRILVKLDEAATRTAGGLYIPDTAAQSTQQRGVVVAVGPGHRNKKGRLQPLDLRIGDRVLLAEYAGDDMQILGQSVKILRESEVLGIIEN